MTEHKIYIYLNLFFISLIGIWLGFSFTNFLFPHDAMVQLVAKFIYGETCHQIPERSFSFDHKSMLICSRCFGIYTGFLSGLVLFTSKMLVTRIEHQKFRKQLFVILLFAGPFISDVVLSKSLIYDSGNTFRFISGFLLFIPFSFIISLSLIEMSKEIYNKSRNAK
jgi:uncharacterized membrane protein